MGKRNWIVSKKYEEWIINNILLVEEELDEIRTEAKETVKQAKKEV